MKRKINILLMTTNVIYTFFMILFFHIQSIPKLTFPGGALIGCTAGFLNVLKIKGIHTAMKSGMLAGEATFHAIINSKSSSSSSEPIEIVDYETQIKSNWVYKELYETRNIRSSFRSKLGIYGGLLYSGIDQFIFRGKTPWTFKSNGPDYAQTKFAMESHPINYPKPDGILSFDLLDNVARTGTYHEENQPSHLVLKQSNLQVDHNWKLYGGLETRFCPAGVYEYLPIIQGDDPTQELSPSYQGMKFQINAQNCIHCKTCDIKDPSQNINWTVPEGGGGPRYTDT